MRQLRGHDENGSASGRRAVRRRRRHDENRNTPNRSLVMFRIAFVLIYFALMAAFGGLFLKKLNHWDTTVPGHCYDSDFGASEFSALKGLNISHLKVDRLYIVVTFYICSSGLAIPA